MISASSDVELASVRVENGGLDSDDKINGKVAFAKICGVSAKRGKKVILHPMDIIFPPGAVTGVMGPSGSGKTTLLSYLTGSLASNVSAAPGSAVNFPGVQAFVPQEDHLHGFYTVEAYARHYIRLSGQERDDAKVKDILSKLGLSGQSSTIVGDLFRRGLSGGQKRRLSVGLEALSSPDILFCDEPTSGLDAESALHVLRFLKAYVSDGQKRVVLTIHQPNSFLWELLDNIVLLSRGHCVYQGPRERMEDFFASNGAPTPPRFNPADHFVTMVNEDFEFRAMSASDWADAFKAWGKRDPKVSESQRTLLKATSGKKLERQNSVSALRKPKRAGCMGAFGELIRRNLLNLVLNPGIMLTRVVMYAMLSGLIAILFYRNAEVAMSTDASIISRVSILFYIAAFMVFMSIAALPFFIQERVIMEKEVRNGYYHPAMYHVAQFISSLPGVFFLTLVTSVIICPTIEMADPTWFGIDLFLSLCCAEALASLTAILVPHYIIGMALVAATYGFFMLLEGFMIVPSEFPNWIQWLYKVPFHTYSFRTFVYKEFAGIQAFGFPANVTYPDGGMSLLKLYEIQDIDPINDMVVLVGWAAALHLFSIAVLTLRYR